MSDARKKIKGCANEQTKTWLCHILDWCSVYVCNGLACHVVGITNVEECTTRGV